MDPLLHHLGIAQRSHAPTVAEASPSILRRPRQEEHRSLALPEAVVLLPFRACVDRTGVDLEARPRALSLDHPQDPHGRDGLDLIEFRLAVLAREVEDRLDLPAGVDIEIKIQQV